MKDKAQPDQSLIRLQEKIEDSIGRATIIGGKKSTANRAPTGATVP